LKHIANRCHVPGSVVRYLGNFAILGLVGIVGLIAYDKEIPEGILTLIAGAVGALASILSSTRSTTGGEPSNVQNQD